MPDAICSAMDTEADTARLKDLRERLQALIREADTISREAAEIAEQLRNRAQAVVLQEGIRETPRLDA